MQLRVCNTNHFFLHLCLLIVDRSKFRKWFVLRFFFLKRIGIFKKRLNLNTSDTLIYVLYDFFFCYKSTGID